MRRFHRTLIAVVLIVSFAAASVASGQGTSGTLPNPMTTQELDQYARRLKLSDQQRQAVQSLHDEYKREFRALREGEIAAFLKDMRSLNDGGAMPTRIEVEAFLKKMDMLSNRIAAIDNRLFDMLQPLLTDEQMVQLPRVRLARQRERYRSQQVMMASMGIQLVDLSEIMMDIPLAPEAAQTADAVLSQYEMKLTSSMSTQVTRASRMIADLYDALEQMGFTEESFKDPETAQKMGEAMQGVWQEIGRKAGEGIAEIGELNRRTFRSLSNLLPAEQARTLRERYYQEAYPEAKFTHGMEHTAFSRALEHDGLTAEQRAAVESLRDQWQTRIDALTDEAVHAVDEFRKDFSPFNFDHEQMTEHHRALAELRTKAAEATATAMNTLNETLGEELAKKVQADAAAQMAKRARSHAGAMAQRLSVADAEIDFEEDDDWGDEDVEADDDVAAEDTKAKAENESLWMGDQFVPSEITNRDLADYADRLGLSESQRSVLQGVYSEYRERIAQVKANEGAALLKITSSLWSHDSETQTTRGPTPEKLEQLHRARRDAIDAVRSADGELFADIELAVLTPEQAPLINRVRQARDRAVYSRGQDHWFFGFSGNSSEWRVNLYELTRQLKLDESTTRSASQVLDQYEAESVPLLRARFERAIEFQQAQERWNAEMVATQSTNDMGQAMKLASRYQELMNSVGRHAADANQALAKLNRASLEKLLAEVGAEHADRLRDAYNRAAYPSVYEDAGAVTRQLTDALRMNELTDEQRRRLTDLAAEYRPAYAELCDKMVQATAGSDAVMPWSMDHEEVRKMQEREDAMAKLRFDRSELNARAASVLRTTLTEDQIKRLGGLPATDKDSAIDEW